MDRKLIYDYQITALGLELSSARTTPLEEKTKPIVVFKLNRDSDAINKCQEAAKKINVLKKAKPLV